MCHVVRRKLESFTLNFQEWILDNSVALNKT